jgi:peptide deformylase
MYIAIAGNIGSGMSISTNQSKTNKKEEYQTEEGCLSLIGERKCKRYKEIEVEYMDINFNKQHGKYNGFIAEIIQHEIDHTNGIII